MIFPDPTPLEKFATIGVFAILILSIGLVIGGVFGIIWLRHHIYFH